MTSEPPTLRAVPVSSTPGKPGWRSAPRSSPGFKPTASRVRFPNTIPAGPKTIASARNCSARSTISDPVLSNGTAASCSGSGRGRHARLGAGRPNTRSISDPAGWRTRGATRAAGTGSVALLAHDPRAAPLPVARPLGLALVGLAAAMRQTQRDLGAAALVEINRQGYDGNPLAADGAQQPVHLFAVQ